MTTTVNLGKIAFVWKGTYSAGTTYAKQDVVAYNGGTYVSLVDSNVGNTPAALTAYWQLAAQGVSSITTTPAQVIYNNGTGLVGLPIGTTGQVLTVSSAGYPAWENSNVQLGTSVKSLWQNSRNNEGNNTAAYRIGMVIMNDNSIRGWGANNEGMLGDGTATNRSNPTRVAFPPGFVGAAKVVTNHVNCGYCIDLNGQLWSWGRNAWGNLGDGTTTNRRWPQNVSLLTSNSIYGKTVVGVYVPCGIEDAMTVMVLCSDGTLHGCGYNNFGQLGNGNNTNQSYFVAVTGLPAGQTVVDFAFGRQLYTSAIAVMSGGRAYVWGYNGDYNLGDGTTTSRNTPLLQNYGALLVPTVTKCGAGAQNMFVIASTGILYGWGANSFGQVGVGSTATITTPFQSYAPTGGKTVTRIIAQNYDYFVTYFILSDGTVWATGYGGYGGNGSPTQVDIATWTQVPIPLTGGEKVTKFSRGGNGSYNYALALTDAGRVYGWGYNGAGQLGVGTFTAANPVPQLIKTGTATVTDIATYGNGGDGGSMYLYSDGALAVSGYGGQYANGDYNASSTNTPVPLIF